MIFRSYDYRKILKGKEFAYHTMKVKLEKWVKLGGET